MNNTDQPRAAAPATPAATQPAHSPGELSQATPGAQRFVLSGVAIALSILGLYVGQTLLMPLALAALLAFVLDPVVRWLRRHSVPRGASVALVMVVALSLLAGAVTLMAVQLADLGKELPTHSKTIQNKLRDLRPALVPSGASRDVARLFGMLEGEFDAAAKVLDMGGKSEPEPTRVVVDSGNATPFGSSGSVLLTLGVQIGTAGLVLILVVIFLLQRRELRDRLLRLMGGDPHQMADALGESAERVSRYLLAQVLVNVGYGIPMALGLWWIGVPNPWLWGGLAAVLRFVPYLGPAMGAIFPVSLAFAVDPGWSMVFWTLGLIATLEIVSNNVVEPLAYGGSTGVSPLAVLLSAAFWASLWGPLGLVLATPLTVCLVVMGRHWAPLRFLDILLSSEPVFDDATQLYHQLIAGDVDEAEDMAYQSVKAQSLTRFYANTALPMLALAARQGAPGTTPLHRHRLLEGSTHLVAELRRDDPPGMAGHEHTPRVLCVGVRSELDALSADMLAHAMAHAGHAARAVPASALWDGDSALWSGDQVAYIHLCTLASTPQTQVRVLCRRLRRRWPQAHVALAAWCAQEALASAENTLSMGVDSVHFKLNEVVDNTPLPATTQRDNGSDTPPSAASGGEHSAAPLQHANSTTPSAHALHQATLKASLQSAVHRASAVFGVPVASLTLRLPTHGVLWVQAGPDTHADWAQASAPPGESPLGRVLASADTFTAGDVHREPKYLAHSHSVYQDRGFFAGVPVREGSAATCGVLALHAPAGHRLNPSDLELLVQMASELAGDAQALIDAHVAGRRALQGHPHALVPAAQTPPANPA